MRLHGRPRPRDARVPAAGAIVFDYGNNLRAQAQAAGVDGRVRLPGVRAGVHPPAVLRGPGTVPLGRAVGRPGRHRAHGPGGPRALPRRRRPAPLDRDGPGARPVPGTARADLLAGLRRAGQGRARLQRPGRARRGLGADRHRSRPPRCGIGRLAQPRDRVDGRRLGRRRRLAAAQRAGQHGGRARRGCRSTTAEASASATASTPAWSSSPTERRWPRRSSSGS